MVFHVFVQVPGLKFHRGLEVPMAPSLWLCSLISHRLLQIQVIVCANRRCHSLGEKAINPPYGVAGESLQNTEHREPAWFQFTNLGRRYVGPCAESPRLSLPVA